ncbi:hypothetical protein ACTFIW_011280 [Dictyostelium discoideum]
MKFNKITIISIVIALFTIILQISESITVTNLNNQKDIEFTMYHNEDQSKSCKILFKPKLIPHSTNSITSVDSINFKKAIQIKCKNSLTKESRSLYQKSCDLFKTTVVSDKDPSNLSFSSLPKGNLNDSSLQYEFLKINLDSNNMNIVASNYQLKKSPPVTGDDKDQLFVIIDFSEDILKLVYEEPKVEKEKEKEKEKEESQSFIGKYWFYLLPLFLIILVNMAAPPPAAQANAAASQGAGSRK